MVGNIPSPVAITASAQAVVRKDTTATRRIGSLQAAARAGARRMGMMMAVAIMAIREV